MAKQYQLKDSEFYLKPAALEKVIYAADSFRDRCILKTLAQTGIRRSELASLDIRDLDLERRRVRVCEGKGAKERLVPITGELGSDLSHLIGRSSRGPPVPLPSRWCDLTAFGQSNRHHCGRARRRGESQPKVRRPTYLPPLPAYLCPKLESKGWIDRESLEDSRSLVDGDDG